jgi:hypothetical protein
VQKGLARGQAKEGLFEVITPPAAGSDVGTSELWVWVPGENEQERVRTFGTDAVELEALPTWLLASGWKDISEDFTEGFFEFHFPEVHAAVDFSVTGAVPRPGTA